MKILLTLFLTLCFAAVSLSAQESETAKQSTADSVLYSTTVYFEKNQGEWIEKYEYIKVGRLLKWAEANSSALIDIKGWCDQSGTEEFNARLSFKRAKAIRSYLVQKGIDSSRIIFEGKGVDFEADCIKARRADVVAYIRLANKEAAIPEPKEKPIEVAEVIEPTKVEDARAAEPIEEIDTQMQVEPETKPEEVATEPTQQPEPTQPKKELIYHAGVGLGTSFGRSTFASFAADGAKVGVNTNIFAGAEFSKLLSAELSIGYTAMSLGMYECCEGLYYVDGECYFAPVAGTTSYAYHDLTAKTNLVSISAKANFNIIALFNKDSKWQALVSPNIGVGFSSAKLNYDNSTIAKESNTHFIVGGALGAIYSINECWGVRLTSGVDYFTGGAFDALPQCEHSNGYIWNTTAGLIYKF